jgi:hypothetical protein
MLNKHPTARWGLTGKEIIRIFIRINSICVIIFAVIGFSLLPTAFAPAFSTIGIMLGCGISIFYCKNVVAPKKALTEFGYLERKAEINSIFVKLGLKDLRTIHETKLWRHFR